MDRRSKKTQHQVAYQFTPNGAERCSYCSMFQPAASCRDVSGVIDRNGWCQLYRPKTNPTERTGSVRERA